jgi:squalene-hopene/tetraprenyl-beta-curcumene cyclase
LQLLSHEVLVAADRGLQWLLRLQNRDGGWPTFCRGWGRLPFDRSGTDLTAHCLRALHLWSGRLHELESVATESDSRRGPSLSGPSLSGFSAGAIRTAITRGLRFLARTQQADGSWLPLWFGNQDRPGEDNPVYGTSKVLMAYADLGLLQTQQATRGIEYLRAQQNSDGGWGGGPSVGYCVSVSFAGGEDACTEVPKRLDGADPEAGSHSVEGIARSTIEETALALDALLQCGGGWRQDASIMQGLNWLAEAIQQGHLECSWPIGFYFAKLWYHESLYPAIFALSALGAALNRPDEPT